jgi:hypothetical protein
MRRGYRAVLREEVATSRADSDATLSRTGRSGGKCRSGAFAALRRGYISGHKGSGEYRRWAQTWRV